MSSYLLGGTNVTSLQSIEPVVTNLKLSATGKDSGLIIKRYQPEVNDGTGDVVAGTETETGTATAGAGSTITFPATFDSGNSSSAANDFYNGWIIKITNDTPAGILNEVRIISDYDGGTKIATVTTAWDAGSPTASTTFAIYQSSNVGFLWDESSDEMIIAPVPRITDTTFAVTQAQLLPLRIGPLNAGSTSVVSGTNAVLLGGTSCISSGASSIILGGSSNVASGDGAAVLGGSNATASSTGAFCVGPATSTVTLNPNAPRLFLKGCGTWITETTAFASAGTVTAAGIAGGIVDLQATGAYTLDTTVNIRNAILDSTGSAFSGAVTPSGVVTLRNSSGGAATVAAGTGQTFTNGSSPISISSGESRTFRYWFTTATAMLIEDTSEASVTPSGVTTWTTWTPIAGTGLSSITIRSAYYSNHFGKVSIMMDVIGTCNSSGTSVTMTGLPVSIGTFGSGNKIANSMIIVNATDTTFINGRSVLDQASSGTVTFESTGFISGKDYEFQTEFFYSE